MKLSIGIIGLPNVGKSTLFNALTKQNVNVANYPFATIDPNVGVVSVPDKRLEAVAKLTNPDKVVPAVIEFYDIAGLVKGAHKGEGLGNKFLAKIREVSVIAHLVRVFESGEAAHIEGDVNPLRDIDTVHAELILKDTETVERKLQELRKDAKAKGDKEKQKSLEFVEKVYGVLDSEKLAVNLPQEAIESDAIRELFLLTTKPQIYVLNGERGKISEELLEKVRGLGGEYIITDLSDITEVNELIETAYKALGLITFFTITGGKEARAWAIKDGTSVHDAAGEVHTDFQEKFIRAEVINWEKLVEAGGWQEAKSKGLVRVEGKEYVVKDGDVLVVRHG